MPAKKKPSTADLKAEFLRFFAELPVQKAGADWVGVNEDTITDWKASDKDFSDGVSRAKSDWAKRNFKKTNPDGLLSRLYPDLKPAKQEVEQNLVTSVTINHVHPDDQLPPVSEAGAGVPTPDQPDDH